MLSEARQGTFVVVPRRSFILIMIIGPVAEGAGAREVVVVEEDNVEEVLLVEGL